MKENMQDLYDKFLESLEDEFEYDVPDSFQIAGITEEELDKILPLTVSGVGNVTVLPPEEEYTERDAFNDFIADQQEDWD
jgi:hypothetical protein